MVFPPLASRRIAHNAAPPAVTAAIGEVEPTPSQFRASPSNDLRPNIRRGPEAVIGRNVTTVGRPREVAVMLLWTTALFLALALASYSTANDGGVGTDVSVGGNWVGPVGETLAHGLVALFGAVSWMLPVELCLLGLPLVVGRSNEATAPRLFGDFLLCVLFASLVQVMAPTHLSFGTSPSAGTIGELFGEVARSLFSTVGSALVGAACVGLVLVGRASFSFIALARLTAKLVSAMLRGGVNGVGAIREAWKAARAVELARNGKLDAKPLVRTLDPLSCEPQILTDDVPPSAPAITVVREEPESREVPLRPARRGERRRPADPRTVAKSDDDAAKATPTPVAASVLAVDAESEAEETDASTSAEAEAEEPAKARRSRARKVPTIVDTSAALAREGIAAVPEVEAEPEPEPVEAARAAIESEPTELPKADKKPKSDPVKLHKSAEQTSEKVTVIPSRRYAFQLPSYDLLTAAKVDPSLTIDPAKLLENAETLVQTLSHYGVSGKVEEILPGPTVTTYEVSPAAGTKVSKVASLADDLALALARKVRIVAPIPGKNRIGFELPNEKRIPVSLRELIEDRRFQTLDVPLPVVLGRDILGHPVYADLATMPHVIVAGATGAGKSVGLNVMLTSLLYRRTPEELRLLMIDPKVVELAPFDRIPHMLLPVVTDMKQASVALKWAVDEMERRYQLFADAGTKNITTFNGWVARVRSGEIKNPAPKMVLAKDHNGLPEIIQPTEGEEGVAALPEKIPFIVVVVDEFADLMMQQGKEVEASVARLAQKARAAGMHVILATQRPSVDVITGMIKANFPTRIAYRVAQKVDSRTILDEQGAEHLLGRGDMLIKLNGTNDTKRVQCPMVSEEEVQAVTDHLRAQGEPVYDENILKPRDDEGGEAAEDAEQDPLYDDAVRVVADTRRCSTSWLQRKLGLGYNRAARIVEMMEHRGLVGPANGAKEREVLISSF